MTRGSPVEHIRDIIWRGEIAWVPFEDARAGHYDPEDRLYRRRTITGERRLQLLERDHWRCVWCGASSDIAPLDIDHVIPRSRGGSDADGNLQVLCWTCNSRKNNRLSSELERRMVVFRGA